MVTYVLSAQFLCWSVVMRLRIRKSASPRARNLIWRVVGSSSDSSCHITCLEPPHTPQQRCTDRHHLVAGIFVNVEWHSTICWTTTYRCSRPGTIHRRFWHTRMWCILSRGVASPHLATTSAFLSIQWQELFAIVAAALTWGHTWWQKHIRFYCDNLVIVNSWEGKSSKHPRIISLLCTFFLTAAKNNFTISLKHSPGKTNEIVDALSRKWIIRFFHLAPQAQWLPTV